MKKVLLASLCAVALMAQAPQSIAPADTDLPVGQELQTIFNGLAQQLKDADNLVRELQLTAKKQPQDMSAQIDRGAQTLSTLVDRLAPNGDMAQTLAGLRAAAVLDLKRVQEMAKGSIEEEDRTAIINAWNHVIQECDKAAAAMTEMHGQLMDVLQRLRMKQAAMSELMLAGQYQDAITAVERWIIDLQKTVRGLHDIIDGAIPRPAGV